MADYKNFFNPKALEKLAEKVRDAADSAGVLDVYAQGANRARAFGELAKLSLELNHEHEQLQGIYTEIGKLYFEQTKAAPEGPFVPLFERASRVTDSIRAKKAQLEALKQSYGEAKESDLDVEIGDFDDIVSATEADGMTVEIKSEGKD